MRFTQLLLCSSLTVLAASGPYQTEVFRAGQEGYHTYRIPALIATKKGTLLAFCEGRRHSARDSGDIDLLLKRSFDGGRSWGPVQLVADFGPDTVGNPAPVVDRRTGTIWLLMTRNPGHLTERHIVEGTAEATRTVWLTHSRDEGASWAPPAEITASVKRADWTWYATGPGNGIQLRSGRLIIPCNHVVAGSKAMHSHVIFSDDGGRSWQIGGVAPERTNESAVAELADGTLVLNMRSYHGKNRRAVALSRDGGLSWTEFRLDDALVEPVCQGSLISYGKNRLLFSNPADIKRVNLTVRMSRDGGRSWPVARQIYAGPSAYSSLVVLRDGSMGLLYERGEQSPYEQLCFARFRRAWLEGR